jgi:photosystem II stability/assembly factor-like uncharacterized protein
MTLTSTTLGLGTEIDSIDMISSTQGFAVVSNSTVATTNRFYLARTRDTGTSWSLIGSLPYKSFKGPPSYSPTLNFVSASVGYVSTTSGGRVFVTTDGGRAWTPLSTPGIWPTSVVQERSALVVSDLCAGRLPNFGPLRCPSVVSHFPVGQTTPTTTFSIPAVDHTAWRAAIALAAPAPSTLVVQEGGTQPGESTHLLESSNDGATWNTLTDPCGGLLVQQLLTPSAHRWLLSCFLDGGMMQGTNQLWKSVDGGRTWRLLAHSGEQRYYVGNIADTWNTLAVSGNGKTLFSAVGGAAGGVESSSDGRHWSSARFNPESGGAPEWIDAFGDTGVMFGNQSGRVWRTFDGVTWTPLKLAAGRYRNLPICTRARDVKVSLGATRVISGTAYNAIIFENKGQHSCYLNGTPSLQPVSGATRTSVGLPATGYSSSLQGGFTVLRAHGGIASVSLAMQRSSSIPSGSCRVRRASGAVVGFNPPASFSFSFGHHARSVCALVSTSQVSSVVAGTASRS